MKSVCIPATPPVDIAAFLPLVDHPHFQRLRERKQLGINHLVFPGAVHTRFEHTLGVLSLTQRLCRIQGLSDGDARALRAFALLHDIGHGPFSHQIEPVLADSHHDVGLRRIREMAPAIAACGADPEMMGAMLRRELPLARWVADRNLGTDKLDYLMRDALHIGFFGTPDILKLQFNTLMLPDGHLAFETKYIEDLKQLQKFYSYLHQHGYLNKTTLIAQRMLQRAILEELLETRSDGAELWDMTDHELLTRLAHLNSPVARALADQLARRTLQKTILVLKPAGYSFVEPQNGKSLAIIEAPHHLLEAFSNDYEDQRRLRDLENRLADHFRCRPGDILVSNMPFFRKLLPQDVQIVSRPNGTPAPLLHSDTAPRPPLDADYLRAFAIRITCSPNLRDTLAPHPDDIAQLPQLPTT